MKIFILLPRFPYPIEKGDKLRAYHQIRHLSKDHDIILCTLNHKRPSAADIAQLKPYCKSITTIHLSKTTLAWNLIRAFFKGIPLQVGYYYSCRAQQQINRLIEQHQPDHIYCQLLRTAEYVKTNPQPKTIDYQDVFSKGAQRRSETAPWYLIPILKLEYKRLCQYEYEVFERFDHKTIISKPDRDLIPHPRRDEIGIIANGVDHDFFKPMKKAKTFDLVFTGNMGYPPNVNSAVFLAREILPLIHQQLPGVKLLLAGASPHPRVQALASDHVSVTGWVDDIRTCYASARIFIAPMQIGTGLQNKLLEAMSMQLPCITSKLANNALGATPKQEILIGETPQDYAKQVIELLQNEEKANSLAKNGYRFVINNYHWESATRQLIKLMNS